MADSTAPAPATETPKEDTAAPTSSPQVTPWDVDGGEEGIDYNRLIQDFGTQPIDEALLQRMQKVIGDKPLHPWLKRGLFFSHRYAVFIFFSHSAQWTRFSQQWRKESHFICTLDVDLLRMPSTWATWFPSSLQSLFLKFETNFARWLQDVFDVPLVIQLTDDEKFLWKDLTLEQTRKLAIENAKDIIAVGFDMTKTFIFTDTDYLG